MPFISSFDPDFAEPSEWARMYRAAGLQVVPAMTPRENRQQWKRPALPKWRDLEHELVPDFTFERWYGETGEHVRRNNMGLICGACSGGVFVIDLDLHKHPTAQAWWLDMQDRQQRAGELETAEQVTGGGGIQLFFRAPAGWTPPTCKTSIGVDIRGQGGFAMMPPSMHESGKAYRWKEGFGPWEMEIAEAPEWLCNTITQLAIAHGGASSVNPATGQRELVSSSVQALDAFGNLVDGREDYMTRLVWAAVVGLYREAPIPLTPDVSAAEMMVAFGNYERHVRSRIVEYGTPNTVLLEREDRGLSMFQQKWKRAMAQWDTKIREAAKVMTASENVGAVGLGPDEYKILSSDILKDLKINASTEKVVTPDQILPLINDKHSLTSMLFPKHLVFPSGIVGEIAQTIMKQANRYLPPQTAIGAALAVLGHASQNKFLVGGRRTPVGLYIMAVAKTGAGKGDCMGTAMKVLRGTSAEMGVHGGHASGTALQRALADLQSANKRPCSLTIIDEIGLKLQQRANTADVHTGALVTTLMEMFGKGNSSIPAKTYADRHKNISVLHNPLVTILGFTTSEPLNKALTSGDAASGFANRFILIEAESEEMRLKPEEEISWDMPRCISELIEALDSLDCGRQVNTEPRIIEVDDEAKTILEVFKVEADDAALTSGLRGALWTRAYQNAIAVAAILAIGNCQLIDGVPEPIVRPNDAQYAIDLVRWSVLSWERRFGDEVADGPQEAERLKILKIIREANNRTTTNAEQNHLLMNGLMPHSLLLKLSKLSAIYLKGHIETLMASEQVIAVKAEGGQRTITCYRINRDGAG